MQNAFYFSSFSRLKFVHKNTSLTQQGGVWQKKCENVIICATKVTLAKSQFISVNCDELTTVDNQSWLFVHAYVTDDWKQLPLLLNMYKVVDETIADNMTSLIVKNLGQHGVNMWGSMRLTLLVNWFVLVQMELQFAMV